MAFPIDITRRRTDIGTGWDARIEEVAQAAHAFGLQETTLRFDFSFEDFGGGQAVHNLGGPGQGIPNGAIVTRLWYNVSDVFTGGGGSTLRVGISGDAVEAVTTANISVNGTAGPHCSVIGEVAPALAIADSALARGASYVSITDNRAVNLTIGGADITAGSCSIFVSFFFSD
jgi:hypothetical protein